MSIRSIFIAVGITVTVCVLMAACYFHFCFGRKKRKEKKRREEEQRRRQGAQQQRPYPEQQYELQQQQRAAAASHEQQQQAGSHPMPSAPEYAVAQPAYSPAAAGTGPATYSPPPSYDDIYGQEGAQGAAGPQR